MSDSTPPTAADGPALGFAHENLEGWIPTLASDDEIRAALEKAFDYRGDVTLTLKDGAKIAGYIFDRRTGATLADSQIRLIPANEEKKVAVRYSDLARIEFTGRDTAAGKSFETWMRKYREKKLAGEKGIGLDPEKLQD